jgi:hypothetical protein
VAVLEVGEECSSRVGVGVWGEELSVGDKIIGARAPNSSEADDPIAVGVLVREAFKHRASCRGRPALDHLVRIAFEIRQTDHRSVVESDEGSDARARSTRIARTHEVPDAVQGSQALQRGIVLVARDDRAAATQ